GPASQLLAVVGGAALIWMIVPKTWNGDTFAMRSLATAAAFILGSGAVVPMIVGFIPEDKPTKRGAEIDRANRLCATMWGLHPIALQPRGVVMTYVDLGPRLVTLTHHDAITGPYHRNGEQIADVMNFWRGSADQ